MIKKDLEKIYYDKCDKLYPKLAYGRCCAVCMSKWQMVPATEIHHIKPRVIRLLRFHPLNLMPLCHYHHQLITDKKLDEPITSEHRDWLQNMSNKDFKGYCIAKGITKEEYYKQCYKMMKDLLL